MDDRLLVEDRPAGDGRLRVLRLHRPAVRNAMDRGLLEALADALAAADADAGLRGLLLCGSDGAFSAGADLDEPMDDGGRRRTELFTTVYEHLSVLRLPTAAAVEGPAIGGGAEVAAACDLRVAAASARLRFPGAAYGVPVGTARTIGQVGLSVARDWVLSGRFVGAEEAYRVGFVQRLVDDGAAEAAALEWLRTVAGRDRATVEVLKRFFVESSGLRDRVAFENDALRVRAETGSVDAVADALDGRGVRTVRPRRR